MTLKQQLCVGLIFSNSLFFYTLSHLGDEKLPSVDLNEIEVQRPVKSSDASVVDMAIRSAWKRILLELSSLPRSMAVMFTIAMLSGIGTIIEQGRVGADVECGVTLLCD